MPSDINSTYLALILKVKGDVNPRDFRLISCCNVIYKILYTILTNRLRPVLSSLVFILRQLLFKVEIWLRMAAAQELLCEYNRANDSKRCMLKIDIYKAYDMVDWNFLKIILALFGFPVVSIKWIMACVTTVKFLVLINEKLIDFVSSNRGLRQGDPLSPFLFTLAMEVLSRRLNKLKYETGFDIHPKCTRINLNHSIFADDVLILSKASTSSLAFIKSSLEDFYALSSLKVNEDKSCIFLGPVSVQGLKVFLQILLFIKLADCLSSTWTFHWIAEH
ncbi:hypothetical protein QQ045_013564 [Rhodiola kirilowii]